MENLLIPYAAVDSLPGKSVLVFAPHPDDEIFGCGGAMAAHHAAGIPVRTIIVTDGAAGATDAQERERIAHIRAQESIEAAACLGCAAPEFWDLPDRSLEFGPALIGRVHAAIVAHDHDLIYAPSLREAHPDHRTLAMAVLEALRRLGGARYLAMYEVGIPLPANTLVDITRHLGVKQAAMRCFHSQLGVRPYDRYIEGLARYRTYTLPPTVEAAEAFQVMAATDLQTGWLDVYEPEYIRQAKLGLCMDGARQLPLVSVIIRSMDRPTLREALDSVALQTYANVEVVVVAACGPRHKALPTTCGRFPLRQVTDPAGGLTRAAAANAGLDAAIGEYLIFLDDDDWFDPDHLRGLVAALTEAENHRVAYSGVRTVDDRRHPLPTVFNHPFDPIKLLAGNYLPIHGVLFHRSLISEKGCRFDTAFDVYEDWDFWLQLAEQTGFTHVPVISANYRIAGTSGFGVRTPLIVEAMGKEQSYAKWQSRISFAQWCGAMHKVSALDVVTGERDALRAIVALAEKTATEKNALMANQERLITTSRQTAETLQKTIDAFVNSTSWRITRPLRLLARLGRGQFPEVRFGMRNEFHRWCRALYWRLPPRWRDSFVSCAYLVARPLFAGTAHHELWHQRRRAAPTAHCDAGMRDIDSVAPCAETAPGRIAIHAHVFYPDLAAEMARHFTSMPFRYDLYVSVPDASARTICTDIFRSLPRLAQLTVVEVTNRGRDLAPMFCTFGEALSRYDFVAHVHSKKSLYNRGATDGWREYLLNALFGQRDNLLRIFSLLTGDGSAGLVYPQNFPKVPYAANCWLANRAQGLQWCTRLGLDKVPSGYFDFPAGSMFWARTEALRPLFDTGIRIEDFPEEAGQTDGTFAHCLERLLGLVVSRRGFPLAILRDKKSPSWSRWRFDQYLARSRQYAEALIADAEVRLVIFDVFDTLLLRPLLDPEDIKVLVSTRAGATPGAAYEKWRATAESRARWNAGRDVGLEAIYAEFAQLSGLDPAAAESLRHLEEDIERNAVSARPDAVALLRQAVGSGKRVVLASDMYLDRAIVEDMLAAAGIDGWHALYLSSAIGLRKDTGALYQHIAVAEGLALTEILVIGDNERSDLQIPSDLGTKCCHIMRPVELARAMPRLGPLVEKTGDSGNLDARMTLGLIVRDHFQSVFPPHFDPATFVPASPRAIGHAVLGPLVLAFAQWLGRRAQENGIQRLYFLSREGEFLQQVYDHWRTASGVGPESAYLVLSRRTVTVPLLATLDDIHGVAASTPFAANDIAALIVARYGLELSEADWEDIYHRGLWTKGEPVTIVAGEIAHLKPLLGALADRILAQGKKEAPGLQAYLKQMGLIGHQHAAVVDIGYSGTIQGRLNRLLEHRLDGYYMITDIKSAKIVSEHGAVADGCFGHLLPTTDPVPLLLQHSFTLEKLLSSNDPQVIRYGIDSTGRASAEMSVLSDIELNTQALRMEIRAGAMEFIDQALTLRNRLHPAMTIPVACAAEIFLTFMAHPAPAEREILCALALDDHYCGRSIVN